MIIKRIPIIVKNALFLPLVHKSGEFSQEAENQALNSDSPLVIMISENIWLN